MYYRCEFANRPQVNCDRCTARGSIRADQLESVVWNYVKQLITEPGYFRAEVERAVDADAKKNSVGADAARTLRADLERLALERSRIQAAFRKGLYTEDELATELETIEHERAPLLNRLELSQMDERHHGARSARLAAADKRLASMRAAAETVDRDQQRAIIAELIERVTVDTETREVEIRVLVGDAPATDESRVPGTAGGDGGAGPAPHSSKGGRRKVSAGAQGYGNGLSPGRATPLQSARLASTPGGRLSAAMFTPSPSAVRAPLPPGALRGGEGRSPSPLQVPYPSHAINSSAPPMCAPSMNTWGVVRAPGIARRIRGDVGSSAYGKPLAASAAFARSQCMHPGRVNSSTSLGARPPR